MAGGMEKAGESDNRDDDPTLVRAAGCMVWRPGSDGPEVLVVHRDRYDDWSFPKGKLEPGETEQACALREVKEETNATGDLGAELPLVSYIDHKGREKTVHYWLLRYTGGEFEPNDEVDKVKWLTASKAASRLSYAHDIELLAHLGE